MAERKLSGGARDVKEVSFADGLRRIIGKSQISFSNQEKSQFEREKYAEEEAKKKSFVLGRQIE